MYKAVVAKVPWLLESIYMGRGVYRHSFLDKLVTNKYRRQNPVSSEIMTLVSKMDRDGFVVLGNYFAENDLKSILAERDEIVRRVASNDIDKKDLTIGSSGTYRLSWSTSYGPMVDKLVFLIHCLSRLPSGISTAMSPWCTSCSSGLCHLRVRALGQAVFILIMSGAPSKCFCMSPM